MNDHKQPFHIYSNLLDQCQTVNDNTQGVRSGEPCIFPFKLYHYGKYYGEFHGCTKKFERPPKFWCPTKLNEKGEYHYDIHYEHYGYCASKCPTENDCVWNPWSSWSPCSKTCGTGIAQRSRTVLKEAILDGKKCSNEDATQTKECQTVACPVCKWSEWSNWSKCKRSKISL